MNNLISKAQKEITEKLGYELDCTPEFSVEQVQEMIRNSPELSRLNNLSNGKVEFN